MTSSEGGVTPHTWVTSITDKFEWMIKQNIGDGASHNWCIDRAQEALKLAVYESFFAGATYALQGAVSPKYLLVTEEQLSKLLKETECES